jgi:GR25 family glycosyltransferase involved in LPS biosynthesis
MSAEKIFLVGTACTGMADIYDLLITRTGFTGCDEKHNQLLIDYVVRKTANVTDVLQAYKSETSIVDKTHLNLWAVEALAQEFPHAIFVAVKRNVNLVIALMLRMQSVKDWCLQYNEMGVKFPSKFLGVNQESDYLKLNLKDRCKARVLSHYDEMNRLTTVLPKSRFFVINYDDKNTLNNAVDSIVRAACTMDKDVTHAAITQKLSTSHATNRNTIADRLAAIKEASKTQTAPTIPNKAPSTIPKQTIIQQQNKSQRVVAAAAAPQKPKIEAPKIQQVPAPIPPPAPVIEQQRPLPPHRKATPVRTTAPIVSPHDRKITTPRVVHKPQITTAPPSIEIVTLPIDPDYVRTDYKKDLKFYWINLERAPHRKERMEKEFEKRNIKNQKIVAFDGQSVDFKPFIDTKIPFTQLSKHKFEVATTLSHLKALHAFANDGADVGIICEDDLSFEYESLWKKSLQDQINEAPPGWTVLQLGLTINIPKEWHNIMAANKTYHQRKSHWYSALAYAVKREHALRVLSEHSIPVGEKAFSCRLKLGNIEQAQSERVVIGTGATKYMVYPPVFTYPSRNDSFIHPNHLRMHESSKNMIAKAYVNNRL